VRTVQSTFVVTFISDDRPGLVEALSQVISTHGGNWLESRLSQLSGKFAGLISISLPSEAADALREALIGLTEAGIHVSISPCTGEVATEDHGKIITLKVLGPDRPGIVREVAAALSKRDINVVDLETYVSPAPMSSELMFHATVEASAPKPEELGELEATLDQIADEMHVHITLEEV
jgi:glycine cleavage system regulatory protein